VTLLTGFFALAFFEAGFFADAFFLAAGFAGIGMLMPGMCICAAAGAATKASARMLAEVTQRINDMP
jgi:hypothetical protein